MVEVINFIERGPEFINILNELNVTGNKIIVLDISYEPGSCDNYYDFYLSIRDFAIRNNLNYTTLKVITGNLIVKNNNPYCEYIPYCLFLDKIWISINYQLEDIINKTKFEKRVLCYNRRPKIYRRYVFYKFYTNPILWDNSYISLNAKMNESYKDCTLKLGINKNELISFYENHNQIWTFDGDSLDENSVNIITNFDIDYHKKTFLSLVTESMVDEGYLCISEKTSKPIYGCQPFIIVGNVGTIKKLREMGYKTFNRWWDESYDDVVLFTDRCDKILKILETICTMSDDDIMNMYDEMKDVLIHNHKLFLSTNGIGFEKILSNIRYEKKRYI